MRTPFFGVFAVKIFWVFRLDQAPKNRSSSIPVSGRRPRACPLGSPPPGRAAQCCDAFKAEVSFCRYLIGLFSCQGALDPLSPVFRQRKKPDAPTERCSLNRLGSVFATNSYAILLNILRRMHPAWDHFSCLCEAFLPHIQHFSALLQILP